MATTHKHEVLSSGPRNHRIQVLVSEEEKPELEKAAAAAGHKLSGWLRFLGLKVARGGKIV